MNAIDSRESTCLLTVGHSNHSLDHFLELLQKHQIQVLVDTRSSPYSRYSSQFNREAIQAAIECAGMKYLFLGAELGGRPDGDEFYDGDGYVLYNRVAESPRFLQGIRRLEIGTRQFRVAVMCSEEDPTGCHRHLLVGRVMAQRGATIQHIRGDGRLQSNQDLQPTGPIQRSLFDLDEEPEWKSIRSVLRRNPPANSSEFSDETESPDLLMSD